MKIEAQADQSTRQPPHILTLVLVAAMGAIGMNMFLPSLPSMTAYFQTTSGVMQFAVSGYLAATALIQLMIGPLSDRFGRRPVLIGCFVLFLIGTLICIYAPSVEILLLGRVVQAFSAAGMVLGRAIVRDLVEPAKAASMIGYVTMGMAVGPMIAPIVGGYLDENLGWQSVFWAMGGMGLVTLMVVLSNLSETNRNRGATFSDQFKQYPILLTSRRFWGYVVTMAFAAGAFFAFLGGGPFIATFHYGLSPSEYGLYFMLISLGYMSGNFISGRKSEKVGIIPMMLMGCVVAAVGLILGLAGIWSGLTSPLAFFGPIFLVGLGNGLTMPNAAAGIVSVRPQLAGSASGLGGSIQIGGGAAIAAIAGIWVAAYPTPDFIMGLMLLSAIISICAGFYVLYVDRQMAGIAAS